MTTDRWTLTLASLLDQPLPPLPELPGRAHRTADRPLRAAFRPARVQAPGAGANGSPANLDADDCYQPAAVNESNVGSVSAEVAVGARRCADCEHSGCRRTCTQLVGSGLQNWTDIEVSALARRAARSSLLGCPDDKGRAVLLLHRDWQGDDRTLCVECFYANSGWRCAKREALLLDQLQFCPAFEERCHE